MDINNMKSPIECSISVIIPVYNCEKYISECLDSVINQSFDRFEVICIDDESTDRSLDILTRYAEMDNRISVTTQNHSGVSDARNRGLILANGKYVYFLDSDDYIRPHAFECLFKEAENKEADVIYFNGSPFFNSKKIKNIWFRSRHRYCRNRDYSGIYNGSFLFSQLVNNREYYVNVPLQFIRRDFLIENDISFYSGIIHEDNLFSFCTILSANKVWYDSKEFYVRRVRDDSIMTKDKTSEDIYDNFVCIKMMIQFIICKEILDISGTVYKYIGNFIYYTRIIYSNLSDAEKKKCKDFHNVDQNMLDIIISGNLEMEKCVEDLFEISSDNIDFVKKTCQIVEDTSNNNVIVRLCEKVRTWIRMRIRIPV